MSKIKLSENFIKDRVKLALTEDLYPYGDITSNLLNDNKIIQAKIISNQKAVVAGLLFVKQSFKQVDKKTKFIIKKKDGSKVKKNSVIAVIKGKALPFITAITEFFLTLDPSFFFIINLVFLSTCLKDCFTNSKPATTAF